MVTADRVIGAWQKVINNKDYSDIEKISISALERYRDDVHRKFSMQVWIQGYNEYLRERVAKENVKKEAETVRKEEWKKWIVASIGLPALVFILQFLYFNETSNRPFLTFRYVGSVVIVNQNHIELDSNGAPYEDTTRKDILIPIEIKSTGGMPANITCTEIYLDYKGHARQRILRDYKNINISPVLDVPFQHKFMILNEGLNGFTIETTFYYYGRKFLGLWYLGRPYKYYCKARCYDKHFEILESKDER